MRQCVLCCLAFTMLAIGSALGIADQAAKPATMTYVTTSAHCDWTWGHSRAWHEERYAQIIHDVLMIMRDSPGYVWQLENQNEQLAPFLKKAARQWPGLIDEFWRRVREGRIEVIVAIANPRITEVYPETFVRNLVLGKQYFRQHAPGIQQKVFNAVDLMCGNSQIPQILAQADYRYFMFSRPCGKRVVFWRTGLDGTRMLSVCLHYSFEGPVVKGIKLQSVSGDDILPSQKLAQQALAWNPKEKILTTSVKYLEELERRGGPDLHLSGVLDSLECPCEGIVHGNRNLYCLNNQNEDLLLSVEKAQAMAAAARKGSEGDSPIFAPRKSGQSQAPDSGQSPDRPFSRPMDQAWHDLLSCTGHAILYCWKPDYEERLEKARQTRLGGERMLQQALAALARSMQFRSNLGSPVVVMNFHAWPNTGPVELVVEGEAGALSLCDAAGRAVPVQRIGDEPTGQRLAFIAENVPSCGYKTFYLSRGGPSSPGSNVERANPEPGRAGPAKRGVTPRLGAALSTSDPPDRPIRRAAIRTIENERYRVAMLPDGRLKAFDKKRGLDLGATKLGGLGDVVLYDAPMPKGWELNGPFGPRHDWTIIAGESRSAHGPVCASLSAKGTIGPHKIAREVRLWRESRRIDYLVEVDAAQGNGVLAIRFPTGLAGRVFAGIPFGAEPREHFEREPFRGEYFVQGYPDAYYAMRWTDNSTPDFGYTFICPPGSPTGYMHKAAEQSLEFMLLRIRPQPEGVWGQVHPSMQGTGRHAWRCALVPHQGTWREAASYRDAMESHVPLLAFSPTAGVGRARVAAPPQPQESPRPAAKAQRDASPLPLAGEGQGVRAVGRGDSHSFLDVAPANVMLSSLRLVEPAEGGRKPEWEIRLYETTGTAANVVLRLGSPAGRVRQTNFLGEPAHELTKIEVAGREIRFTLPPWKIVTLRVSPGE